MHPLIARSLDLAAALRTLERSDAGEALAPDEAAFARAAAAHPKARAALLRARGAKKASPEAQQHLIVIATRAATLRLVEDPALGPPMARARAALEAEGATAAEVDDLLAQAVLEEAFGYAEDPDHFDADFLGETFATLANLARVTQDTVDDLLEAFARQGEASERALRLTVAEHLLEAAWSEGPQPITPEHVDDAVEQLAATVAAAEFARAGAALRAFLVQLAAQGVVGPQRAARLAQVLEGAVAGGAEAFDEAPDAEDDAEEGEAS